MIGLIIIAHDGLAEAFLRSLENVMVPQKYTRTINVYADSEIEDIRRKLVRSIKYVDRGRGVLIVTDMFGGTPSNLAISVMKKGHIEVVGGVNLPMLVKFSNLRQKDTLESAANATAASGVKYINVVSNLLEIDGRTAYNDTNKLKISSFIIKYLEEINKPVSSKEIYLELERSSYFVSQNAMGSQLSRLASTGRISRIAHGVYAMPKARLAVAVGELQSFADALPTGHLFERQEAFSRLGRNGPLPTSKLHEIYVRQGVAISPNARSTA